MNSYLKYVLSENKNKKSIGMLERPEELLKEKMKEMIKEALEDVVYEEREMFFEGEF